MNVYFIDKYLLINVLVVIKVIILIVKENVFHVILVMDVCFVMVVEKNVLCVKKGIL